MFIFAYSKCSCLDCDEVTIYLIEADTIEEATRKWREDDIGMRFLPQPTAAVQFVPLEEKTLHRLPFVLEQIQN